MSKTEFYHDDNVLAIGLDYFEKLIRQSERLAIIRRLLEEKDKYIDEEMRNALFNERKDNVDEAVFHKEVMMRNER